MMMVYTMGRIVCYHMDDRSASSAYYISRLTECIDMKAYSQFIRRFTETYNT